MKSIKIILVALIAAATTSCNFDISLGQTTGNGNVVTQDREVADFKEVKGSAGLDVYLTQGSENKVVVEADENLQELIETEVVDGKLRIGVVRGKNIGRASSKKVHVTFTQLEGIYASSGADVIGNSVIDAPKLVLDSSSGADLEVEIEAGEVIADCSSGADLKIRGRAEELRADASSGSDIKAQQLVVQTCYAEASSGADITVNVKESLTGKASSGGDIKYYGNPTAVSAKDGYSGNIRKM